MSLAFDAMVFARRIHAGQRRRYTGLPYFTHLAEVAGIMAAWSDPIVVAAAWLHDSIEDGHTSADEIKDRFGLEVAKGVVLLTDDAKGNRAERAAASRARLSAAPDYIQTIKVADIISNTASIRELDPAFAAVYLPEKAAMLDVLTRAEPGMLAIAREQVSGVTPGPAVPASLPGA